MLTKFFAWIRNVLVGKPATPYNVFMPKERMIYEYFDGTKVIRVDPMEISRKLSFIGPELDNDLKGAKNPNYSKAPECQAEAVKKIREVFDLKPVSEGGLEEVLVIVLLYHFLEFENEWVKKNSPSITTIPAETLEPTSPPIVEVAEQPTSNTTPSGSSKCDPSDGSPTPSPGA